MILQPPTSRSSVRSRNSQIAPANFIIGGLLFILIVLSIRVILAALGIEPWIVTWQVVYVLSFPLVWPFQISDVLNSNIVRQLTYAEVLATFLFSCLVLFVISSVAVRGPG